MHHRTGCEVALPEVRFLALFAISSLGTSASAQRLSDAAALIAAQRDAMRVLAFWGEVGDRITPGKDPVRFFEMDLTRVGDADWPGAGVIPAK